MVRRLLVPGPLSSVVRKGVGLAFIAPPAEFLEALSQELEGDAEPAEGELSFEIEILVDDAAAPAPSGEDPPLVARRGADARERASDAAEVADAVVASEPTPEDGDLVLSADEWDAIVAAVPADEVSDGGGHPETLPLRCEALVVHTGELDDVAAYIRGAGVVPLEIRPDEMLDLGIPVVPIRLIAMSAATAFKYPLETVACTRGASTLALIEGGAVGAFKRLDRQGFDFVVQRPVRDTALRMLVEAMIYRDVERRNLERVQVGAPISVHTGVDRRTATLLETSRAGCRIEWDGEIVRGTRVTLRIPSSRGGRRALKLAGRVVRVEPRQADADDRVRVFSVAYETLGRRTARRLNAFIEERASSLLQLTPVERGPKPGPTDLEDLHEERRARPRHSLRTDAVAVADAEHACAVLLGTELSLGGMHVGPYPDLEVDDQIDLVIHSSMSSESVAVSARVVRDDGPRGLALAFVDLSVEATNALAVLLAEEEGSIRPGSRGQGGSSGVVLAAIEASALG